MGGNIGKGSEKNETATQSTMPPRWAQPLYTTQAKDAMRLYNSGQGGNVYQGDRVSGVSRQSQNALNGLENVARHYDNQNLQELANSPTMSAKNLAAMASGQDVKAGNPSYQERLHAAMNDMGAMVNSQMSGAGRYGSGANTKALAKGASAMLMQGLENDYNRTTQNMLDANRQIDRAQQDQLSAANNFYQGQSNTQKNALAGGQVYDQYQQNKLNADWQKWQEQDNRDWERLGRLQNAMAASAGRYGVTNGKNTTTQSSDPLAMVQSTLSKLVAK